MAFQKRKTTIAIVGGGEGAKKAIHALRDSKDIRIGAVVCKDNELRDLIDPSIRINLNNYDDVFKRSDIEALYLATPNNTHIDLAIEATKAGKHLLIEKPLAISYEDASRLIPFISNKTTIAVAFKKRFGDGIIYLKNIFQKTNPQVRAVIKWYNPRPSENWRYDYKTSGGGVVMDLGSHVLDLLEFLLGEIADFDVILKMSGASPYIDETADMKLSFKNIHSASIDLRWTETEQCQRYYFFFANKEFQLKRMGNANSDIGIFKTEKGAREMLINPALEYLRLFSAWHDAIQKRHSGVPDLKDGFKNQNIIDKIYLKARCIT